MTLREPPADESDEEEVLRLGISSISKKAHHKIPEHIHERVLTDIGQASMCWDFPEHAGAFDTKKGIEIGDALCQYIVDKINEEKK
jgi:hypothetical protein